MDFRTDPRFPKIVAHLEQTRGIPAGVLQALVAVESGGNPNAVSKAGARGLTQFMPATAKQYDVDVNDPVDSLRGAADFLQDLGHQYKGNWNAALSHYNGGAHNAKFHVDGTAPTPDKVSASNFATNRKYVEDINSRAKGSAPTTPSAPSEKQTLVGQVNSFIADLGKQGASAQQIISQLVQNETTRELVKQGRSSGMNDDQIVAKLGGAPFAPIAEARAKVGQQNFAQNAADGAGYALSDMGAGAKQLGARVTGDDSWLAELQAQQKAAQADPTRMAVGDTAGGVTGSVATKALPYVAGAVATGGSALPLIAGQAAVGAASGALTPTTEEGQFAKNIALETALGGGTAGGGVALGKLASSALRGAGNKLTNAGTSTSQESFARAVGEKLGVSGATKIDDELIRAADDVYRPLFDDAARGNTVHVPTEMADTVNNLKGSMSPQSRWAATRILKEAPPGETVSAEQWLKIRSEISTNARTIGGSDAHYLGELINKMDDVLESSSSLTEAQKVGLKKARETYRNLQPVEAMVSKSSNSGVITPNHFNTSIRSGRTDSYARGEAPLQDLKVLADKLSKSKGVFDNMDNLKVVPWLALDSIVPGAGTIGAGIRGGEVASHFLRNTKAGAAALRGAGSALGAAGNAVTSPVRSALMAQLIRKGLSKEKKN